jgi:hypothetical protein
MIRVDKLEEFPIVATVVDDDLGSLVTGQTVYYEIRDANVDVALVPPISGILSESSYEPGVYRTVETIPTDGEYIIYTTCSGYISGTEDVIVNPESIYDLTKQNRQCNISVEDVVRTNAVPTASQLSRNVPLNKTDYIVTLIKSDNDSDWDGTTVSGVTYAHYETTLSNLPYKMGGPT